jgi:hypothetical protein
MSSEQVSYEQMWNEIIETNYILKYMLEQTIMPFEEMPLEQMSLEKGEGTYQ